MAGKGLVEETEGWPLSCDVVTGDPSAPVTCAVELGVKPAADTELEVELTPVNTDTVDLLVGLKATFFVVAPTAPPMIAARMTMATMTSMMIPFLVR